MGVAIIARGADFSAIAIDKLGIYTSVRSGLISHFETRSSAVTATKNRGSGLQGSISGVPTYTSNSMVINRDKRVLFGLFPTGNRTSAVVVKSRTTGGGSWFAGAWNSDFTGKGAEWFNMTNTNVGFLAMGANEPSSGPSISTPSVARWDLYVGTAEANVQQKIQRPRDAVSAVTATPTQTFLSPNAYEYSMGMYYSVAEPDDEVAVFAHWNRVLTPTEIATFYAETQSYLAIAGIAI